MDEILIPFPSLKEQKVIVAKAEALMEKCTALEEEISRSEQHAQMLMQAVLKEAFQADNRQCEKEEDEETLEMVLESNKIFK